MTLIQEIFDQWLSNRTFGADFYLILGTGTLFHSLNPG